MENMLHYNYEVSSQHHQPSDHSATVGWNLVGQYQYRHHGTDVNTPDLQEIPQEQQSYIPCGSENPSVSYPLGGHETALDGKCATPPLDWQNARFEPLPPVHVYAPTPLSGRASFLRVGSPYEPDGNIKNPYAIPSGPKISQQRTYAEPVLQAALHMSSQRDYTSIPPSAASPTSTQSSQSTFLTPSELLVELSGHEGRHSTRPTPGRGRLCAVPRPLTSTPPDNTVLDIPDAGHPSFSTQPNDSTRGDISSHEKKRHYLECLEQYVTFLHSHFRLIGLEPVPLERISNYRGLNSRSIRSLLIRMEKMTKQMKEQILKQEQRFLYLCDALERQEALTRTANDSGKI